MKKLASAFPQGQISLVMLGQTMYYAKSSPTLGRRIAQSFSYLFTRRPKKRW
jgi:hypothetical protein